MALISGVQKIGYNKKYSNSNLLKDQEEGAYEIIGEISVTKKEKKKKDE